MNNEESKLIPSSRAKKYKSLAEHWIGLYLLENKLDIKNPKDIDGADLSRWLLLRKSPKLGQKRNISTSIKSHFGIKLLHFCGNNYEESIIVAPSMDTFKRTASMLYKMYEINRDENPDVVSFYWEAYAVFVSTSIMGISIVELARLKIVDSIKKRPSYYNDNACTYELKIIINSGECNKHNRRAKEIYLAGLPEVYHHCIENLPQVLKLDSQYGLTKVNSKIQYIIRRHNEAKGCGLRLLRSSYPGILGYLKPTG
jgi:hypothetical protein